METRWSEFVGIMQDMGSRLPTKCTLFLPSGEVFSGEVGGATEDGDNVHIVIGADTAVVARADFHYFTVTDPVPGYEYEIRVE